MPMTEVDVPTFEAMLERIEEYDTSEDTARGSQLISYYAFDRRFAQEVYTPDEPSHYLLDHQHCERLLYLQQQAGNSVKEG